MKSSSPAPGPNPPPDSSPIPEGRPVHEMFETQVASAGDAIAVVCAGERLSYRALNSRSNRLARRLRRFGVTTDALVPIVMDRSISMVVAILGSLKAGAGWLPLDPAGPKDRLAFMLGQARAAVILTEERLLDRLPAARGHILALDRRDGGAEREDDANLGLPAGPSGVAYALYTSVPTGLRALLDEPGLERCRSLRRVFCGGETLSPDLVERFFERLDAELINLYGPTEACIDSTFWVCGRGERTVPIGRPIQRSLAYVLDRRLRPQPPGGEGELYIAGAGLARGYLEAPDLTAERFLPDPFSGAPGARLYATGDRARLRLDGSLEFLGRVDDQVKVRGYRVEPGEIEAILNRHPSIAESIVVARPDPQGGATLAAYATLRKRAGPALPAAASVDLRAHLKAALPDYMVPSAFVVLDDLPRTASGKIDRRRR